jgi:hypothetical protein
MHNLHRRTNSAARGYLIPSQQSNMHHNLTRAHAPAPPFAQSARGDMSAPPLAS